MFNSIFSSQVETPGSVQPGHILDILGDPVDYAPQYTERFYSYSPDQARVLLEEYQHPAQRGRRAGNVLHLAIEQLKLRWVPELSTIDIQDGLVINGGNRLESIVKSGVTTTNLTRLWASGVDVMSKMDQGASRTIRDYYRIAGEPVDSIKSGAMGVIDHIFTGRSGKQQHEFLDPYYDYFRTHFEAIRPCLIGNCRTAPWAGVLTLGHAINSDRALKLGHLVANNAECERGKLLFQIANSIRDKKGKAPTGGGTRNPVIIQLMTGMLVYISRGNVDMAKLRSNPDAIREATEMLGIEVVTFETLLAEFNTLKGQV